MAMPGRIESALPIFSASSSKELALAQVSFSFKITIRSLLSIAMGSVGTSPLPVLVTTFSTSSKPKRIADIF